MNILRFKYLRICKKFNLNVNISMRFIEIKKILDEYFIKKSAVNKIIKTYRKYKNKEQYNEMDELRKENMEMKNIKKENFILKSKMKDMENKILNYNSIISNYNKFIKIIKAKNNISDNDDINLVINNKFEYNMIPKLSINKMKKILEDNKIITKDKSKHELKKSLNELSNNKFYRITDKIYSIKKLNK